MFTKSSEIINALLKKYGITEENYSLFVIWEKETGKMSQKMKLVGKKGKSLIVEVQNPTYRQELRFRKNELINKINDHFGKKIINEIKTV